MSKRKEHQVNPYTCSCKPPNRVWIRDASGQWSSRAWKKGEKAKYAAEVLGQVE
jgi:hypothetical protein